MAREEEENYYGKHGKEAEANRPFPAAGGPTQALGEGAPGGEAPTLNGAARRGAARHSTAKRPSPGLGFGARHRVNGSSVLAWRRHLPEEPKTRRGAPSSGSLQPTFFPAAPLPHLSPA